jgi:16S rRNA G527 N7-methylase RsmG
LEEVIRELELEKVDVMILTAEAAAASSLAGAHALATARAVAPPDESFALLLPLVQPGGAAVTFLGKGSRLPRSAVEWSEGLAIVRQGTRGS